MARLKFGYTGQTGPPFDRNVRALPRIEGQGWDFVRYPDQMGSTHPYGMMPGDVSPPDDPEALIGTYGSQWYGSFELMSAASLATTTLGLQCAVIDPLRRSPSVFAQEAMSITHLSKGRANWCIGSGEQKQFEPFGETRTRPIERMIEALHVMNTLWDNPYTPVSRESPYWPLKDAVFPLPKYEGLKPNIRAVGGGPKIEKIAGELCDGWMTFIPGGVRNDPASISSAVTNIKGHAAAAQRDPDALDFSAMAMIVIAPTDDEALELTRDPIIAWPALWGYGAMAGKAWKELGHDHPFGEDASWPKNMKVGAPLDPEFAASLPGMVPEGMIDATIIHGSPDTIVRRLEPFVAGGLTELSFLNMTPWVDRRTGSGFAPLISEVVTGLGGQPLKTDL